jgi:hypothetical protein
VRSPAPRGVEWWKRQKAGGGGGGVELLLSALSKAMLSGRQAGRQALLPPSIPIYKLSISLVTEGVVLRRHYLTQD